MAVTLDKTCLVSAFKDVNPLVNAKKSACTNVLLSCGGGNIVIHKKGGKGNDVLIGGCGDDNTRRLKSGGGIDIQGDVIESGSNLVLAPKEGGVEYAIIVVLKSAPNRLRSLVAESWEKAVRAALDAAFGPADRIKAMAQRVLA